MRADRLVAVLLLLQQRGRVTAAEVADELEISERTARRDLDALAQAGVPVYSQQGRGGGWSLLGGGRIDLTGLTAAEVRALFLVAGPGSSGSPALKAALRKVMAALPAPQQTPAARASSALLVDPATWGQPIVPAVHLDALEAAVVEQRRIRLGYAGPRAGPSTRLVDPYGLVAKGPLWYLVAATERGDRLFRVDRVTGVDPTDDHFEVPDDFDLAEVWRSIVEHLEEFRTQVRARARISASAVGLVQSVLGERATVYGPDGDGWLAADLGGRSVDELAGAIAGFGASIVVLEPPEVVTALRSVARQLNMTYGPG